MIVLVSLIVLRFPCFHHFSQGAFHPYQFSDKPCIAARCICADTYTAACEEFICDVSREPEAQGLYHK